MFEVFCLLLYGFLYLKFLSSGERFVGCLNHRYPLRVCSLSSQALHSPSSAYCARLWSPFPVLSCVLCLIPPTAVFRLWTASSQASLCSGVKWSPNLKGLFSYKGLFPRVSRDGLQLCCAPVLWLSWCWSSFSSDMFSCPEREFSSRKWRSCSHFVGQNCVNDQLRSSWGQGMYSCPREAV